MTRTRLNLMSALIVAVASGALVTSCSRGTQQPPPAAAGPPTIEVVTVTERQLDATTGMPGELEAYENVEVYPRVAGFVKAVRVDRGSQVRAGDLLALLETPELDAQRAEAESRLHGAEAQLGSVRAKTDADSGTYEKLKAASATPGVIAGNDLVVAQKAVEADRSQVTAAERAADAARQALRAVTQMEGYLRLTAPFDGVVTERNVHPGALVGPGTGGASSAPLFRLVQDARLRLVVPVPERFVAGVDLGSTVSFTVPAYPAQTFSGRVARMAHALDVKTRTMAVELDVENGDRRLAPGTYCQVRWPLRRTGPSLLVPTGSVASTTDRTFVVRVRNNRIEWIDVKTGVASGPLVEVFGDLHAGDEVAARGTDEWRPGAEARPKVVTPAT